MPFFIFRIKIKLFQIPEFDNLYLDMNGIIHNCSHPNDDDVSFRISEEQIMQDIFAYIEKLYSLIHPQKVFFMAIDGVAPRAKMNQQRARRFMSARTAQEQMEAAKKKGVELPDEKRFDSNCITPGTPFMARLHAALGNWVQSKVDNDPNWQGRRIYLSGHNCPGEGEHKIMDFVRAEKKQEGYDPNTRHCMYGLDADLMMLGMCSHEPHFSLLREEVVFNRPKPKKDDSAKKKKKAPAAPKRADPDGITFHLLHLSLLREYLAWEFKEVESTLPFAYDMERIIDDWVLMGFLVGNDFLPHLPHVHIHDDALPLLYKTYIKVLPKLDGYINESGLLNLKRFQEFLKAFAENDRNCFLQAMEDEDYMQSKKTRYDNAPEEDDLVEFTDPDMSSATESDSSSSKNEVNETFEEKRNRKRREAREANAAFISSSEDEDDSPTSSGEKLPTGGVQSASEALKDAVFDPVGDDFSEALAIADFQQMDVKDFGNDAANCWTKVINNSFKRFKKNYYSEKMNYANITREELRDQAESYVHAIQWNLHYYYHGCVSWSWFYKHHYAPYISDVVDFTGMEMSFELSSPLRPFEQLLAVLPAASADCLPKPLQELMCNAESPIADFYPTDFSTDLNGKKNDWEAVVLIPFINCQRLLDAIHSKENQLSAEEKSRNAHGPHILFTWDEKTEKATREEVDKDVFRIPQEQVVWGLLPNVKLDIYFPGFPTMKHLKHLASLQRVNVKVFQFASKKPSIMLKLEEQEKKEPLEMARDLISKEILISWPILKMALVHEIWADGNKYEMDKHGVVAVKSLKPEEKSEFDKLVVSQKERMYDRYAIDAQAGDRLIWVRHFIGLSYTPNGDLLDVVKQWAPIESIRPMLDNTVVTNAQVEEGKRLKQISIEQAYQPGSIVFPLSIKTKAFGWPGKVEKVFKNQITGKWQIEVRSSVGIELDVRPIVDMYDAICLQWMDSYEAAKMAQINYKIFSRITGTVFLWNAKKEDVEAGTSKGSGDKLNIGLALKATKKQQEVPDYTYRTENGFWVYSTLCAKAILEYKNKFKDLFEFLSKNDDVYDNYYAEDVWSNEALRTRRMSELKEFLEDLHCKTLEKQECGIEYCDSNVVGELERFIKLKKKGRIQSVGSCSEASRVFKADLYNGSTMPDPSADFLILDRIVVCRPQPFGIGNQGTVVAVADEYVDVLFDEPISGGYPIRGKLPNGYRLKKSAVINITFTRERKTDGVEKKNHKKEPRFPISPQKPEKSSQRKNNRVVESADGPFVVWAPKKKPQPQAQASEQGTSKATNPVNDHRERLTDAQDRMTRREEIKEQQHKKKRDEKKQNEEAKKAELQENLVSILGINSKSNKKKHERKDEPESSNAAQNSPVKILSRNPGSKIVQGVKAEDLVTQSNLEKLFANAIKAPGELTPANKETQEPAESKPGKRGPATPMEPNPASSSRQKSRQRVFRPSRYTNPDPEQEQNAKAEKETIELMKQMSLNPSMKNMQKYPDFRPSFDSTRPPPNYPSASSSQTAVPPSVMSVLAVQPSVPNPFNPMPVSAVLGMHHPVPHHSFILPHPNQLVNSLQGPPIPVPPPQQSGYFFGNSRTRPQPHPHNQHQLQRSISTPQQTQQIHPKQTKLTDLKPSTVSIPNRNRYESNKASASSRSKPTTLSGEKTVLELKSKSTDEEPGNREKKTQPLRESPIMNESLPIHVRTGLVMTSESRILPENSPVPLSNNETGDESTGSGIGKKKTTRKSRVVANFTGKVEKSAE
ncbi:hypothetical protein WR25_02437 [Diploscapter pachys]|uniref:Uncharacterized protein n=1 Tax=Diploscapter pachys TaxID=2018661 RepID=A0A2A2KKM4_9BILA|nr:hypothetical protein WR25_02437 [Diploscapter pachys]